MRVTHPTMFDGPASKIIPHIQNFLQAGKDDFDIKFITQSESQDKDGYKEYTIIIWWELKKET